MKGERKERVGEVFVFPQRARSSWVKSRERKKRVKEEYGKNLSFSLFSLSFSLDLLARRSEGRRLSSRARVLLRRNAFSIDSVQRERV